MSKLRFGSMQTNDFLVVCSVTTGQGIVDAACPHYRTMRQRQATDGIARRTNASKRAKELKQFVIPWHKNKCEYLVFCPRHDGR